MCEHMYVYGDGKGLQNSFSPQLYIITFRYA